VANRSSIASSRRLWYSRRHSTAAFLFGLDAVRFLCVTAVCTLLRCLSAYLSICGATFMGFTRVSPSPPLQRCRWVGRLPRSDNKRVLRDAHKRRRLRRAHNVPPLCAARALYTCLTAALRAVLFNSRRRFSKRPRLLQPPGASRTSELSFSAFWRRTKTIAAGLQRRAI